MTSSSEPADGQVCEVCGEEGHLECFDPSMGLADNCPACGGAFAGTAESVREHVCSYCPNCDGRKCMDCVTRTVHDRCEDDCPDCCPDFVPYTQRTCDVCDGMGAVEVPESPFPCPGCHPAQYLAELVLWRFPVDTPDARMAAEKIIGPRVVVTGTVEATAQLAELMNQIKEDKCETQHEQPW